MKYLYVIVCFLCLTSCKNDDKEDIDCALFDPAISSLFIKLVDSDGNNLIENETYKADDITVLFNNYTTTNVVFKDIPELNNLIALNIHGENGNNTFKIKLSENEIDTLILNLKAESSICNWTFFKLNSATYNGIVQTLEDFNGDYLITIIK
jgi:hypothetical protein